MRILTLFSSNEINKIIMFSNMTSKKWNL